MRKPVTLPPALRRGGADEEGGDDDEPHRVDRRAQQEGGLVAAGGVEQPAAEPAAGRHADGAEQEIQGDAPGRAGRGKYSARYRRTCR